MPQNHYISTHPTTGQVATRSSANRTYTHCVWVLEPVEQIRARHLRNADHLDAEAERYETTADEIVAEFAGRFPNSSDPLTLARVAEWASNARVRAQAERILAENAADESTWGYIGFQGRPDLAEKEAARWAKRGCEVQITEAVQVASKAEQKRAYDLSQFNLTTTDGETYSLADDAEELSDAELAEAREIADAPAEIDHAQATAVQVASAAPFTYEDSKPPTLRIDSIVCFGPSDRPKTLGTVRSNDWALANALQVPSGAVAIEGQHRFWFARPIPGSSVRRFGLSCVKVLVYDIETTVAEVSSGSFTIVGTVGKVVTFDGVQSFYTRPENVVEGVSS